MHAGDIVLTVAPEAGPFQGTVPCGRNRPPGGIPSALPSRLQEAAWSPRGPGGGGLGEGTGKGPHGEGVHACAVTPESSRIWNSWLLTTRCSGREFAGLLGDLANSGARLTCACIISAQRLIT